MMGFRPRGSVAMSADKMCKREEISRRLYALIVGPFEALPSWCCSSFPCHIGVELRRPSASLAWGNPLLRLGNPETVTYNEWK